MKRLIRSVSLICFLIGLWHIVAIRQNVSILPGPKSVVYAIAELAAKGVLIKHVVASMYRVTWGYLLAAILAIPCGLILGSCRRAECALNPVIQILRPISPLAWIPIAILWFGVGDLAAVSLIFLASLLPLMVCAMNAAHSVHLTYICAGRNFGLSKTELAYKVLFPAVLPQLVGGLRISLGVAWLVLVAAEMLAVNSGLGFVIVDSRNAGNRYDLVVAGMVLIGGIGLLLDAMIRKLEKLRSLRWSYGG